MDFEAIFYQWVWSSSVAGMGFTNEFDHELDIDVWLCCIFPMVLEHFFFLKKFLIEKHWFEWYLSWPDNIRFASGFKNFCWEVDSECYLSWPEVLWLFYCLPSMLDFAAICGVPEHLAILLFAFDAWFWCYLSWPEVLLEVLAFLRCLQLFASLHAACCDWSCSYNTSFACLRYLILTVVFLCFWVGF